MRKILLAAIAAGSLFACNKQEATNQIDGVEYENTVTLTVQRSESTRSITDQIGTMEYAVIGSGKLYFINNSGSSIYQRELTALEIADLANTTSTAGGKTVTITGVPNTATSLYFMANIRTTAGAGFPIVDGATSADARLRLDKLQADVKHVPMSGLSTTFAPAGATVVTASVALTPIVARLELGQITCQNQNGVGQPAVSSDITGYKLSGVFINNVRQSVLLNGTPYLTGTPIDIKNQAGWGTGWASYFAPGNSIFPYFAGGSPVAPGDWVPNAFVNYCTPTGNPAMTFYPDETHGATSTDPGLPIKKAWAYQVCPSTTVQPNTPADVPHLILKLTDVSYQTSELGEPIQYITVTKYKDGSGPITEFKRGHVYRIENLIFTHNEATDEPYQQNITVTATVTVVPWEVNPITPDWN